MGTQAAWSTQDFPVGQGYPKSEGFIFSFQSSSHRHILFPLAWRDRS